ncbi:hypothetical protein FSP39_009321 [Pinctada imbricata]|uniref:C-type lectin domain-containing protein n=1 Tax=Pinctada imbricata TaxID=66713 RepID=A0AA88XFL3_PINIB|nr:hypothetical protein FSP39_009321 [Pinctada imbricata]
MSYYIGATDISSEGLFKWQVSGTYLYEGYADWCPSEPDDFGHKQDCVMIWSECENRWDDMDCSSKYGFICE